MVKKSPSPLFESLEDRTLLGCRLQGRNLYGSDAKDGIFYSISGVLYLCLYKLFLAPLIQGLESIQEQLRHISEQLDKLIHRA
jgi:hypothetical protein